VDFTLEPKKVTVLNVELLSQTDEDEFEFKIDCKGGTYIRSLARDIAYAVNTVGTMSKLTRTASGVFSMENGVTVEEFMSSDNPQKYILPADMAVDFNKIVLSSAQAQKILDGVYEDYGYLDGTYRVYNQSEFWGVGVAQEGKLRIKAYVR
jgi:tRNA pseudouridine55 synthase